MKSSSNLVDLIRDKIVLSDYIGKKVKLNKKGTDYLGLCPFHNEKTPSFTVSDSKGFYHCFGCSAHGDAISFAMHIHSVDFKEAIEILAKEIGVNYSDFKNYNPKITKDLDEIKDILKYSKDHFISKLNDQEGADAIKYLQKRNISDKAYAYFEIGYAKKSYNNLLNFLKQNKYKEKNLINSSLIRMNERKNTTYDFFRGRLMFPIHDHNGNLIAFGGRSMNGENPKYINSSDSLLFKKRKTLYNMHRAKKFVRKHKLPLILVEGYIDVISMYHVGMYGAVAPLGTSLSEDQLLLMWKYCDEPIVCMDGDNAGYKSAVRTLNIAIPILKPGKSLKFTFLPEGKDPDNLISDGKKDLLEQKIKNPISMFDFFWQSETKNILLDTPERRAGFKRDIEKKISSIIDKTVKQEYKNSYYDYFNKFILKRNLVKNNKNNYNSYNIDRIIVDRAKKNLNINKREINLIESILNNPHILNELDEDFSVLPIVNKELDYIRSGIVNIYAKNGPLSEEDIEKFKKNVKYSDIYDKYFNNINWINKNFIPPYVKKNNDDVLVIKNWREAAAIQLKWYKKNYSKAL